MVFSSPLKQPRQCCASPSPTMKTKVVTKLFGDNLSCAYANKKVFLFAKKVRIFAGLPRVKWLHPRVNKSSFVARECWLPAHRWRPCAGSPVSCARGTPFHAHLPDSPSIELRADAPSLEQRGLLKCQVPLFAFHDKN